MGRQEGCVGLQELLVLGDFLWLIDGEERWVYRSLRDVKRSFVTAQKSPVALIFT